MIEILQLPSGHSAVVMDHQLMMDLNVKALPYMVGSNLLMQVAESLQVMKGGRINAPELAQPALGWTWTDMISQRKMAMELEVIHYRTEVQDAGIRVTRSVQNDVDDNNAFYIVSFAGDEPQTDLRNYIEMTLYSEEEDALRDIHDFLVSVRHGVDQAPTPGM